MTVVTVDFLFRISYWLNQRINNIIMLNPESYISFVIPYFSSRFIILCVFPPEIDSYDFVLLLDLLVYKAKYDHYLSLHHNLSRMVLNFPSWREDHLSLIGLKIFLNDPQMWNICSAIDILPFVIHHNIVLLLFLW